MIVTRTGVWVESQSVSLDANFVRLEFLDIRLTWFVATKCVGLDSIAEIGTLIRSNQKERFSG